jgi:transposase
MGRPSKYTPEFRREALELVRSSGRPAVEVARSLGISDGTLGNWVRREREAIERAADPSALSESEREELARLRREVTELRVDREILRKAALALNSTGQGNIGARIAAGVSKSRVLRGLVLSFNATSSRSFWVRSAMLTPFGKYCRSSRLVFSLVPRCQGLLGSAK